MQAEVPQAQLTVVAGPARSGKTERLLREYRGTLAAGPVGSGLWLSPTFRGAAAVRDRLLCSELPGCFAPGIMTFAQFAEALLDRADVAVRFLNATMKRQLLERLLGELKAAGRLGYFGVVADKPGFLDLVGQFISELKRVEVWPDEFGEACRRRGWQAKDQELLALYTEYQRRLTAHNLYDAEGRFWSARALLRAGQQAPFEQVKLVVVDGFTDFTRTQHEILSILAERADRMLVSLPLEQGDERADLFGKSRQTLARLRQAHPRLELEEVARRRGGWAAMAHLEEELFKSPRRTRNAESTAGIEIIAAASPLGELETIGRTIKRLLVSGDESGAPVSAERIAVVYRSLGDSAPLVREVFGQLGIPYALEAGQRLAEAPVLRALVALLELDAEDWPFRRLLAVLANNYFRPRWRSWRKIGARAAVEWVVRELQMPAGRDALINYVTGWAERKKPQRRDGGDTPADERRAEQRRQRAALALPVLEQLRDALDGLPRKATAAGWTEALAELAGQVGLLRAIDEADGPVAAERAQRDRTAWQRLLAALQDADRLAECLGDKAAAWSRQEMVAQVKSVAAEEQLGGAVDETGRVRVLSAATVRTLSVDYLFFAGLSEKAVPPPARDDRLYGEAETQRLAEVGLPLVLRAERSREEMLLFYEVITRPARRLYLSYPALDDKAQPLLASPYLAELERSCGTTKITRHESADLSPLPPEGEPFSIRDLRIGAVVDAVQKGEVGRLAGLVAEGATGRLADNLLAALVVAEQRGPSPTYGPFEGVFAAARGRQRVAERFGPAHVWSASQLEGYLYCPYRFFLGQVLRIEEHAEPGLATDYLARGVLVHEALVVLHELLARRRPEAASPAELDDPSYRELVEETLAELDRTRRFDGPVEAALYRVDRRLVSRWLGEYHQQHTAYDTAMRKLGVVLKVEGMERAFGDKSAAGGVAPLEIDAEGAKVLLRGRIDRIDSGRLGNSRVFVVIDYKSGSSRGYGKKALAAGNVLQLPLYAMAVAERLLSGAEPIAAGYWFLKDGGFKEPVATSRRDDQGLRRSEDWQAVQQAVLAGVAAAVRGVREGAFPMDSRDEKCTGSCPYSTVCRVNQTRALEKQWPPPSPS